MNLITWPYYSAEFLKSQALSTTFIERFWAKVRITDSCWLWTAGTTWSGYGQIHTVINGRRRMVRAHKASWILSYGPIPDGINVLHKCDNPPCVRPQHLFLGTQKENIRDAMNKGRFHYNISNLNWWRRLNA